MVGEIQNGREELKETRKQETPVTVLSMELGYSYNEKCKVSYKTTEKNGIKKRRVVWETEQLLQQRKILKTMV